MKQPVNSSAESPFNAFSTLVSNKQKPQRKSSDNLISFEKEGPNLIEGPLDAPQQQQKYNHAQFHTVSGGKPKEDFINFESLIKNNDPPKVPHQQQQQHHQHNNYLLNPNANHFHQNAGHYSTGHFGNHPQPQQHYHQGYDRAQYVTMNINMNMYPKVMNINMNPQTNNYLQPQQIQQPLPNYLAPQTQPQQINQFADHFLGQAP